MWSLLCSKTCVFISGAGEPGAARVGGAARGGSAAARPHLLRQDAQGGPHPSSTRTARRRQEAFAQYYLRRQCRVLPEEAVQRPDLNAFAKMLRVLPPSLQMTNTHPFNAWLVVIGDATGRGTRPHLLYQDARGCLPRLFPVPLLCI